MKTTRRSFIEGTIAAAGAAFLPIAARSDAVLGLEFVL